VVPAAAVDAEKARWRTKRRKGKGYLFSHQALAKVFRAKMLAGADFLWLVLQHVLPKGFRRARNFGFLHPNCKRLIALLHLLLKFVPRAAAEWVKARAPILCACCGAVMAIVRTRIPPLRAGGPAMPPVVRGAF
ncbi:MAG: transposase, partial [Rhodocyclaceae bacterium]